MRGWFLPWIMAGVFHELRAAGQVDMGAGQSHELYTGGCMRYNEAGAGHRMKSQGLLCIQKTQLREP